MRPPLALCYHAITDEWRHPLATSPSALRRQLLALAARGFTGTTFTRAALGPAQAGAVAVTFDDAFASVANAVPILAELGWPATVFAVTANVDTGASLEYLGGGAPAHARPLDWDALASLAARGWEVGSHSVTHRQLSRLADGELEHELVASKRRVEERVGACTSISYPFGEIDARVVAAARAAGYDAGSGLAGRFVRGDALAVPRFAIAAHDDRVRFMLKTSTMLRLVRETPAWSALDSVRRRRRPLGV